MGIYASLPDKNFWRPRDNINTISFVTSYIETQVSRWITQHRIVKYPVLFYFIFYIDTFCLYRFVLCKYKNYKTNNMKETDYIPKSTISAYENDKVDIKGSVFVELPGHLGTTSKQSLFLSQLYRVILRASPLMPFTISLCFFYNKCHLIIAPGMYLFQYWNECFASFCKRIFHMWWYSF